jgi:hypothetical protein
MAAMPSATATTPSSQSSDAIGRWQRRDRVMATTLSGDGDDAVG